MQANAILLRYHEVALKGDNRKWFEDRLAVNARKLLQRALFPGQKGDLIPVSRQHGRIILHAPWSAAANDALTRVFGISSVSPMRAVPTDKEQILAAAIEEFNGWVKANGRLPQSFRVLTRRSDKALPEKSGEIDFYVGGTIKDLNPDLKIQMEDPELTLGIEIRFNESFLWIGKFMGPGGLPVGSNSELLALLSGGLDSPVAAIQALRRGAGLSYLHFYGTPFVGEDSLRKVEDLARIINRYQPDPRPLHVIPFGKIQEKIALATPPKLRTVLYRRMMLRMACALAAQIRAQGIITGEALGQVASQTMENLATINAVATLPVLRPMITYDKDDIIAAAKRWGTYEKSIQPAADCCTLFADRHPSLRTSSLTAEEQEKEFPVEELAAEGLRQLDVRPIR